MLRRPLSAALALATASLGAVALSRPAQAAGPTVHAGLTSDDAAPSCWAIKQSFPSSNDGIYWLATAGLVAPQPFYCDMTTDGGGWVLVGRGRNGWKWRETGQGTAAAIRTIPAGTPALPASAPPSQNVRGPLPGGGPPPPARRLPPLPAPQPP